MTVTQIDLDDEFDTRRRCLAALERIAERYERGEFDMAVAALEDRKGAGAASTTCGFIGCRFWPRAC